MISDAPECLGTTPGVGADLRSAHAAKAHAAGATRVDRRLPSLPASPLPTHRLGSHGRLAGRQRVCDHLRLPVPLGLPERRGLVAGDEQRVPLLRERRSAAGELRALREATARRSNTQPTAIATAAGTAAVGSSTRAGVHEVGLPDGADCAACGLVCAGAGRDVLTEPVGARPARTVPGRGPRAGRPGGRSPRGYEPRAGST
jgi:hypothetical protein